ncbi:MAG: hypothetical protein COA86_13990 [Kangiella sp.]|nr:MAG: hypothetical protein COA86_13990 [Kangiella sp.]
MPSLLSLSTPFLPENPSLEETCTPLKNTAPSILKTHSNLVSLDNLLKRSDIWQASQQNTQQTAQQHAISTGYAKLDAILHYRGWPLNALTEILVAQQHIGEIALILPSIAKKMKSGGALYLIEPPFNPYAPAWLNAGIDINQMFIIKSCQEQDWLWASEQVMGNKGVACCLFWPPKDHLSNKILKRLQLASKQGSPLNFIFRQSSVTNQSSPASLRLMLRASSKLEIEVIKQQGGWSGQCTSIHFSKNKYGDEK